VDKAQAVWSRAWAANLAALELMQDAGVTRFSPVKPQRWVVAPSSITAAHTAS
jgi:hypothetical protein